jgi:hypothetical protein
VRELSSEELPLNAVTATRELLSVVEPSVLELVGRAQRGEPEAFDLLARRYQYRLT